MSDSVASSCSGCPEAATCSETPETCSLPPKKEKGSVRRLVAVGSGKGGVGKSSVTALLAVALAKEGKKVGILDADVTGPSIPKLLGIRALPEGSPLGMVPPRSPELGICVMSVNLLLEDPAKPVVWRGPLVGNLVRQFWEDVFWGELDVLLVDLPPGTSDSPLTVMQSLPLDGMLVVTSPQELSLMVVEKAMHMTKMLHVPLLGLVENLSFAECPKCKERIELFGPSHLDAFAEKWNVPVLGRLPWDPFISRLGDKGRLEEYVDLAQGDSLDALATTFREILQLA
ncbi:Mrp/NBP35 family ATP-binding protein [Aminiphilus sp.]|uniref:Mrp/NBP35 family ATP-binding protein n=1 Tax=Aminiphilus sp. TaxID=1872488 RepID=UPI002633A606|nr:Mrp/NBP35 family ATP-binding protein [Aminiphilus sp.]